MLSPEKIERLKSLLGKLPETLALPLAQAVEADRQSGGTLLPHDLILESLPCEKPLAGDELFAEIARHGSFLRAIGQPDFDTGEVLDHLARFSELSGGIVNGTEAVRAGQQGQRLLQDRAAVAAVLESLLERAPTELLVALPLQTNGAFGGGPLVPNFDAPIDAEKTARALRYVRLAAGCKPFADAALFGVKLKDALEEMTRHLRGYDEFVVAELRSAEGPHRAVVERQFALATKLTATLFGEEEAQALRRRAREAAPA